MVEAQVLRLSPQESGVSRESTMQRDIRWFARRKEYKGIPWRMKQSAKHAAYKALLIPREDLYHKIVELDKDTNESFISSTESLDKRLNHPLLRYRAIKLTYFKSNMTLSDSQTSAMLTKLDRMLIASQYLFTGLSRKSRMNSAELKKTKEFRQAHRLCIDIVNAQFRSLPFSEQRDLHAKHFNTPGKFAVEIFDKQTF